MVGPQSVDPDSASASATSFSLRALTSSRSASRVAKYALRRLVNALRAADSRFHSAASTARSACGAAFHSSSSSRIRSPLLFQWVASAAICSASATIRSLISLACTRACSRAALASSRRWPTSSVRRSRRARSPSRSPSALASVMLREQPLDAGRGLGGSHVRGRDPLLEQDHLGLERLVLALEEGDGLLRAPRLPRADHPLAVGGTDIDRPVGVYPAPRMVGGGHGEPPALSCSCQVFLIVTLSMMTFSFGAPPPADRHIDTSIRPSPHSGRYPSPEETVAKGV